MLSINWSDVWKMVESIKVPLIVIGVALALAIIVSLAVFKMGKPARKLTRSTAWVAAFVAIVVAVVSMMYGGFKTVLDLAAGTGSGSLSKDNPTTTLLDGLHNAGFTTNDELTNLYTAYRASAPRSACSRPTGRCPSPRRTSTLTTCSPTPPPSVTPRS